MTPDTVIALADRLEPVQAALADLVSEYQHKANADNLPGDWQTWSDLYGALMGVRAVQGRAERDAGPRVPFPLEARA